MALALPPATASGMAADARHDRHDIAALAADLLSAPPPAALPGGVRLVKATDEPGLALGFGPLLEALPGWRDQAIVVEGGRHRLEAIASALGPTAPLACVGTACRLDVPLILRDGALLVIDGLELRLEQASGAAIIAYGDLFISDSRLLGWNAAAARPARTDAAGDSFRPFIVGLGQSHSLIRRSHLAHLGFQAPTAYGLAFATYQRGVLELRPSADLIANTIHDLYFGFYSFEADGVRILRNRIERSHVYGIDPHDATRALLIAENVVLGAKGSHGVVLSREINDAIVIRNRSMDNAGAGFFVDKGGWNITFAANEALDNGMDGITVYESYDVRILRNVIDGNGRNGIRIRASRDIVIEDNIVHANAGAGIAIYDWDFAARAPTAEEISRRLPISATITGNRLAQNGGRCSIRGAIELQVPPDATSDC